MKERSGGQRESVAIKNIIELCRKIKDDNVKRIILGLDYLDDYEAELQLFEEGLREDASNREAMFTRLIKLGFLYVVSKFTSIDIIPGSNCETRIKHAVDNLYDTYNVTDDVVRFVVLNIALGLDASQIFRDKFEIIARHNSFYDRTDEYINIFKHVQKLRQSSFKVRNKIPNSAEYLYELFLNFSFLTEIKIVPTGDYVDGESKIVPCGFEIDNKIYQSKYALAKYTQNEYSTKFIMLRSIDELDGKNGKILRLNYSELQEQDTSEPMRVFVTRNANPKFDRGKIILAKSVDKFYSYVTGGLIRKRHRMSFCNGLASYKYYGELAASIMDALEILAVAKDKQFAVIENYILPVIKNNFNICMEDCVCTGIGCKFEPECRLCNADKIIKDKAHLKAECLKNMDIISILTILFSVVGCKEILPQIFAKFEHVGAQGYEELFAKVCEQLKKRFSEFKPENVDKLRGEFYEESIKYLSLNIDEESSNDPNVAQTLKPFKIRAFTDALIYSLENLDNESTEHKVNPSENVYSIQSRIDLISSGSGIMDARTALKDTLKIIIAYYSGLASCKQQQLDYEIKAEQNSYMTTPTIRECERSILKAFKDGVREKVTAFGDSCTFYSLFKTLLDDCEEQKSDIAIMVGRELVNPRVLKSYILMDDEQKKCYLIKRERRDNFNLEEVYRCDLDSEEQCNRESQKFLQRVIELLYFFKGDDVSGRSSCYPQVLTHTSSRVNVDNTTINSFTVYESEQYTPKKEYNVITYFSYEISKRYFYVAPKKFEKTRWITYPILIRCSKFYNAVIKGEWPNE